MTAFRSIDKFRSIQLGSSRISHFSCIPSLSPFHILKSYIYSSSPACQPNSDDESSSVGRPRIRVQDILSSKADTPFTIPKSTKLDDAISFLVKHRLSCCLALDKDGTVAGVFTARDVLRFMDKVGTEDHAGKASAFKKTIADLMTKKDKLVYCAPHDTVRKCREIMFQASAPTFPSPSFHPLPLYIFIYFYRLLCVLHIPITHVPSCS